MKFDSRHILALAFVWGGGDALMVPGPKAQTNVVVWKSSWKDNHFATRLTETLSGATGRGIGRGMTTRESLIADMSCAKNIETLEITYMQEEGCALRTWSFPSPTGERFTRMVTTTGGEDRTVDTMIHDGRLMHGRVYSCQGPNNTPVRMEITNGKGNCSLFKAGIERREGYPSLFVPITPPVGVAIEDPPITATGTPRTLQEEVMSFLSSISAVTVLTVLNWTNLPFFAAIAASTAIDTVDSSVEAPLPWIVFFQKAFLTGGVATFMFVPYLVFAYTGTKSELGAKIDKQQSDISRELDKQLGGMSQKLSDMSRELDKQQGNIVKQLTDRIDKQQSETSGKFRKQQGEIVKLTKRFEKQQSKMSAKSDKQLAELVKQQGEKIDSLVDKMFYRIENQDQRMQIHEDKMQINFVRFQLQMASNGLAGNGTTTLG